MPTVSVRIPQIGEGLQEARLVALLKQPGDKVRRDEPIYQMETDKAVMDVESPFDGVLTEWLAKADDILAIGAEVARMEVGDTPPTATTREPTVAVASTTSPSIRNQQIPPRTRAYAKEKGIADDALEAITFSGSKMMPSDVDAYLSAEKPTLQKHAHEDRPVPSKQRVLNSRMVRGNQLVVPGTMSVVLNWEPIEAQRAANRASGGDFQPSAFTMFAFAVVAAMKEFPAARTTLIGDDTFRTYEHVSLGIAVSREDDELVLAVVDGADTLDWHKFASKTRERIEHARAGHDQAHEAMTISLTNMQAFGLRDAAPVVVPPSCGTIFLGEVYASLDQHSEVSKVRRVANAAFTLDHRIMNGVGAAHFLNRVREHVENIEALLHQTP